MAAESRVGGLLNYNALQCQRFHMGSSKGYGQLYLENGDVPIGKLLPTRQPSANLFSSRRWRFALKGSVIDITSVSRIRRAPAGIARAVSGVPLSG